VPASAGRVSVVEGGAWGTCRKSSRVTLARKSQSEVNPRAIPRAPSAIRGGNSMAPYCGSLAKETALFGRAVRRTRPARFRRRREPRRSAHFDDLLLVQLHEQAQRLEKSDMPLMSSTSSK